MLVSEKVIIIVNDDLAFGGKMQYGFVKVKGMNDDIFFNTLSSFQNTSFEDLKIGDRVRISVKQTDRGPFAESLILSSQRLEKEISPPLEVNL
ncbi:MAG: cold shock domain-containing protein [Bdellovibrionales bacterium]|nr:cold shock domain-containing protein [Bdellovibrionales bacterium]